eukprot:TRINITY_DN1667_c0_g1_i1.p1 TRINITY_DN1667_c0_g1~~TRINITY_DN1667_c0_g1_i1.p1  ORF type:complete len:561 (+),score=175.14 TRINITY_DN1667_c0_g1_i1:95-1684(+)
MERREQEEAERQKAEQERREREKDEAPPVEPSKKTLTTRRASKPLSQFLSVKPVPNVPKIEYDAPNKEVAVPVYIWLKGMGLDEYGQIFADYGYDDLGIVAEITEQDLDYMKIVKPGHRKKILLAASKLERVYGKQSIWKTSIKYVSELIWNPSGYKLIPTQQTVTELVPTSDATSPRSDEETDSGSAINRRSTVSTVSTPKLPTSMSWITMRERAVTGIQGQKSTSQKLSFKKEAKKKSKRLTAEVKPNIVVGEAGEQAQEGATGSSHKEPAKETKASGNTLLVPSLITTPADNEAPSADQSVEHNQVDSDEMLSSDDDDDEEFLDVEDGDFQIGIDSRNIDDVTDFIHRVQDMYSRPGADLSQIKKFLVWAKEGFEGAPNGNLVSYLADPLNYQYEWRVSTRSVVDVGFDLREYLGCLGELGFAPVTGKTILFGRDYVLVLVPLFVIPTNEGCLDFAKVLGDIIFKMPQDEPPAQTTTSEGGVAGGVGESQAESAPVPVPAAEESNNSGVWGYINKLSWKPTLWGYK